MYYDYLTKTGRTGIDLWVTYLHEVLPVELKNQTLLCDMQNVDNLRVEKLDEFKRSYKPHFLGEDVIDEDDYFYTFWNYEALSEPRESNRKLIDEFLKKEQTGKYDSSDRIYLDYVTMLCSIVNLKFTEVTNKDIDDILSWSKYGYKGFDDSKESILKELINGIQSYEETEKISDMKVRAFY